MSSDIAIKVNHVSKHYHVYEKPSDRLKQSFYRGSKKFYKEFKALDDVSFEVKKGETIGIIGRNGAGKSTLLQMICGTLTPSSGDIQINGRVAALLELGAGFNPEFTGAENVYLNAALLGLTKKEIDERYEEILEFAGIGDFINQPVKTYSSGMYVRLGFAIQANIEPEILIVDEALAVGDAQFVHRCMLRFNEMQKSGVTILFVSHDANSVRNLCSRAIWLVDGGIKEEGASSRVVDAYLEYVFDQQVQTIGSVPDNSVKNNVGELSKTHYYESSIPNIDRRLGDGLCKILGVGLYDVGNNHISVTPNDSSVIVRVTAINRNLAEGQDLVFGYSLRNRNSEEIASSNSDLEGVRILSPIRDIRITVEIKIKLPLIYPGSYALTLGVAYKNDRQEIKTSDRIVNAIIFTVTSHLPMHTPFRFETVVKEISRG